MYTLTFHRSRSKHFQKALDHLLSMGGSWDGETARLEIMDGDILTAHEDLKGLFQYISKWETLEATFEGRRVKPYLFIFHVWHSVNACRQEKDLSANPRHCWASTDARGWGCRLLQKTARYAKGPSKYRTSNRYWYNYGEFDERGRWIVNKALILQKLQEEVQAKALHLCPHFKAEAITEAVSNLPDYIEIDNRSFSYYYTPEYVLGEKRMMPVNIRHIPPPKELVSIQQLIHQDPWETRRN